MSDFISQDELRRARELQDAFDDAMANLAAKVAEGSFVEPGELAMLGSRVVWTEVKSGFDRFRLFHRLLDVKDLQFFGADARRAAEFRKTRARIFLGEVRRLRAAIAEMYRLRRDRVAAAGKWAAYWTLLHETTAAYAALAVLSIHGRLFLWRIPLRTGFDRSGTVVYRYVNFEPLALDSRD